MKYNFSLYLFSVSLNGIQLFTEFTASHSLVRIDNTNKIQKTLGLKYQIPTWYRFGIGIPKRWYTNGIFNFYYPGN